MTYLPEHELEIDIETYSEEDLIANGVYKYTEHPSFEVLLFGFGVDGVGKITVIDLLSGEEIPADIMEMLYDRRVHKTAFNANFERTCIAKHFGTVCNPQQWHCTAVMAAELGLPNSLEKVARALNLPSHFQKDKRGKALINYFSKPCRPTKKNGGRTRNLPIHDPAAWQEYITYNRQDVVTERAVRQTLSRFEIDPREHDFWVLDQQINDRGVQVSLPLVKQAITTDSEIKHELEQEAIKLTGLPAFTDSAIKGWIKTICGVTVTSLEKSRIDEVRNHLEDCPAALQALDIRAELKKTSNAKYKKALAVACTDSRIRGATQFYGAGRTGRWAGRFIQMQNLPKNTLRGAEIDTAREVLLSGMLPSIYDRPSRILSELIRTMFVPKRGCEFTVADYHAIEAVLLAWFADEAWRLDVFGGHGKIYEASAERMFSLPPGSVTKDSPERQKGKVSELALGYGGAEGALINMGALKQGLEALELRPMVQAWRKANPAIVSFWWESGKAMSKAIRTGKTQETRKGIRFRKDGPLLRVRLPSGRELSYVQPRVDSYGNITYMGLNQYTRQWERIDTYGPKIVENIVQATARDCIAEAIVRCEARNIPVVFHVHDEVITENTIGKVSASDLANLLSEPMPWAPDLVKYLTADAYTCSYYRKE